jgi:hypothetical protein
MSFVISTSRAVIITAVLLFFSNHTRAQTSKGSADLITHSGQPGGKQRKPAPDKNPSPGKHDPIPLTASGEPRCLIITVAGGDSSLLINRAVESIAGAVKLWNAVYLPVVQIKTGKRFPTGPGIVLVTFDELRGVAPEVIRTSSEISKIKTAGEQGFAIAPVGDKVFVVSRSARGVYNGAVYLRDFLIDGPADGLVLRTEPILREPAMNGRPAYTLSIWGNEAEYTASDWRSIFQAYARDGIDTVYFWVSGHFPSAKYPQTYKCADGQWDTTVNSRIGTIADQRAIIRHAHDLGLKLYLGGGMGAWCGTGLITNKKPGTMKTGPGDASGSLCPSNPESRTALTEYYVEMFDALPEADGVYIELGEEWGECLCAECARPIDKLGSKQFGRSLLTLARDIADKIRRKHPHAKFAFTVGYDEHAHDPAFYQMISEMGDEHYEWMEARGRWEFAGPDGKDLPASHFSRHVMKWKQWYNLPLETLVKEANRAARSDFYGLITSFEPGFASGSFYKTIPFPTDLLPYVLTGFACREMTWEPTLSLDELKQRVHARFFGKDAAQGLTDDLWALREIIRLSTGKRPMPEARLSELTRIAEAVEAAWPSSGPKTREGLELMRKAIADTRKHFGLEQGSR